MGISNQNNLNCQEYSIGDDLNIRFRIKINSDETKSEIGIQIKDSNEMPIFHIMARDSNYELNHMQSEEEYVLKIEDLRLFPGNYSINIISANTTGHEIYDIIENALTFQIIDGGKYTVRPLPRSHGLWFLNPEWKKMI